MALMSGINLKTGLVEEHNQAQLERTTLPLLSTAADSSPSEKIMLEWKRESKINDEQISKESNTEAEGGEPDWTQTMPQRDMEAPRTLPAEITARQRLSRSARRLN